jgi:hypothetical protein
MMVPMPSLVPSDNETIYLVLDDFGDIGMAYREADPESSDFETVISCFLMGEFSNPIRVIAFNTAARWCDDVSVKVAREIQHRCDLQIRDVPSHVQAFVDRHTNLGQLDLRLS